MIFAWQLVSIKFFVFLLYKILSVYCVSNFDCESLSGTTVCKETVDGGAKTCQVSSTCTNVCSSEEFCSAANQCQYGKSKLLEEYQNSAICLVFCAVMSDCSTVVGFTSCTELSGGPITCQAPSTCLATTSCTGGEYCSSDHVCMTAG